MVSDKIGRNDPCPCGSGSKYKNCHLGKEDVPSPEVARQNMMVPAALGIVGGAAAIAAGVLKGIGAGLTFGVAAGLFIAGFMVLRNPPKGDPDRKDPGGINFGG
jgi:hypothetical protein